MNLPVKLLVSEGGLEFLKVAAETEVEERRKFMEAERLAFLAIEKKRMEAAKELLIQNTKSQVRSQMLKIDFNTAFTIVSNEVQEKENQSKASFVHKNNRGKRYPTTPKRNDCGGFTVHAHQAATNNRSINLDAAENKVVALLVTPERKPGTLLNLALRNMSATAEHTLASFSPASKTRSNRQKKEPVTLPDLPIPSSQILKSALYDLESKAAKLGSEYQGMIARRLKKYKNISKQDLGGSFAAEIREVQELSKLLEQHVSAEQKYCQKTNAARLERKRIILHRADASAVMNEAELIRSSVKEMQNSLTPIRMNRPTKFPLSRCFELSANSTDSSVRKSRGRHGFTIKIKDSTNTKSDHMLSTATWSRIYSQG